MRRLAIGLLGAALLLGALAVVVLRSRLDGLVQEAIETRGSALTQTAVRVESVSLSLHRATATLRGFSIANPPGYTAPSALTVDEATVSVALGTVLSNRLVMRNVEISGPRVFYEVNAEGTANIDVLREAIEGAADAEDHSTATATPAPASSRRAHKRQRRFLVERFGLSRGEVHIDTHATGGAEHVETLEAFELTDIGAARGGATPKQVARTIAVALARDIALSVAAGEIERALGKTVGGPLGDAIKKGGAEALGGKGLGDVLERVFGR